MESGFLLDVVVRQSSAILQLLSSKDETLLIWRNTFLVLNFGLDIFNGVTGFNFKGDCLSSQSFDKDLHSSSETKHQMESGFLLDVVVRQSSAILQLLSSKDETLLVWRNSFLVLNLGLNIFNGVASLNFKGDGLSSQGFDKDLHSSTKTEHQMKGGFLLDVVIG